MHWGPNVWLAKMRTHPKERHTSPNSAIQLCFGALCKEGKLNKYFWTAHKRKLDTQAPFQTGSSAFRGKAEGRTTEPIYKLVYGNASPLFHFFKRKKCACISSTPKNKTSSLHYRNAAVSVQSLTDQSCHGAQIWSWHFQTGCSWPSVWLRRPQCFGLKPQLLQQVCSEM